MRANLHSHNEKLMTILTAGKEKMQATREAYFEKTEACLESKDPTSLEVESEAEYEEVPKEEAAVQTEH
jgi:hypothetical protein